MDGKENAVEITPERQQRIKDSLIALYCDQYGVTVTSMKITKKGEEVEPA